MKILLIDPPFYRIIGYYNRYFPYGPVSIATYLKDKGHEALVYDADCTAAAASADFSRLPESYPAYLASFQDADHPVWQEVRSFIAGFDPDLVGIAVWTTFAASAFHAAALVKQVKPGCPVVMGGPHAAVKADEIFAVCPDTDYVIRCEGEEAMGELADAVSTDGYNLELIRGLSYKDGDTVVHNPVCEGRKSLDEYPVPDRTLLVNEKKYAAEDLGLIMTSRGCPFHCSYCVTDHRVGFRSVSHVMEEIRTVRERYGTAYISFKDDSFTINKNRVREFCRAIGDEPGGLKWECNTRVDLIDGDLLDLMKRAGCAGIKIGVESGSPVVLETMNKGIDLEQVRQAAALFAASGIHWTGYFMMGIPGETEGDVIATREFMECIKPDFASLAVYEPFPGTALFEAGVRKGLVKPDMNRDDFFHTLPCDYYKTDPAVQSDCIAPERFDRLAREMKAAFHQYNAGFDKVVKRARSKAGLYLRRPGALIKDIRTYLSWR